YSLGVILYEMLTGQTPFDASSPIVLAIKQASEEPRPLYEIRPGIAEAINAVVMHALEKQPQNRPQTVINFAQELEAAIKIAPLAEFAEEQIDAKLIEDELLGGLPTQILPVSTPSKLIATPSTRRASSTKNKALSRSSSSHKAISEKALSRS